MGWDSGGKKGKGFQEHLQRTHGQNQRGVGLSVGVYNGWGGRNGGDKMETTVLEQQLKN